MTRYEHLIDGHVVDPADRLWFPTVNPYTGKTWAGIARGSAADIDRAVAAAQTARRGAWGAMTPTARGKLLVRLAELIEENAEHLATIEVRDNGKLYSEMLGQVKYLAEWYRYYGGLADKVEGSVVPSDKPDMLNFTRHEPMGVIGIITPWNSPLLLLAWKLAPALAAGNCAVIKPSEHTSASTLEFALLFGQAGFPPGVVNVVTGFGHEAGSALVDHPGVAKIAFTGSDQIGQLIYEQAARSLKAVTLELGGKSPNIVFKDADPEAALIGVVAGIFAAAGQTCIAGSRLLVQRSIHDAFVERLVAFTEAIRPGDPMDPATQIGPIATEPQFRKIVDYIAIARDEGARCATGGGAGSDSGLNPQTVQPTIFTGVDPAMRIAREEVFGPVLAVIPFEDEEDAIRIANGVDFGLAAGVWTADIGRAIRMSEQLDAGTVWINTYRAVSYTSPFGGTKRSGLGFENGIEAIRTFTKTKSVWLSTHPDRNNPFTLR